VQPIALAPYCVTLQTLPLSNLPVVLDAAGTAQALALPALPASTCAGAWVAQAAILDALGCGGLAFTAGARLQAGGGGAGLAIAALRSDTATCPAGPARLAVVDPLALRSPATHVFPAAREFTDVAVTPDGRWAVAADTCQRQVVIVDLQATPPVAAVVPLSERPLDLDMAGGRFAVVTLVRGAARQAVHSIDLATRQIVHTLLLAGASAESVDVSADGTFALVTSDDAAAFPNEVRRIDVAPNGVLRDTGMRLAVTTPKNVVVSPRTDEAIVCSGNAATLTIVTNLAGPLGAQTLGANGHPQSAVFHPSGDKAYVRSRGLGTRPDVVEVLARSPAGAWAVTNSVPLPAQFGFNWLGVDMLAMTAGGHRLVVHALDASASGQAVVIDTATDTIVGVVALPNDAAPAGIASIGL
jgi:hypothetical protein